MKSIRDIPFLSTDSLNRHGAVRATIALCTQAGLLTLDSIYRLRLPILKMDSDIMQLSSPITAAGPSPIYTGFPIKL
jgi:hypothetical protein